ERGRLDRVEVAIESSVHPRRARIENALVSHLHRRRRFRGASDGVGLQYAGMSIAGAFAGDDAQTKALRGVEGGRLQPAIVPGEALGAAVFDEQLAVVRAFGG